MPHKEYIPPQPKCWVYDAGDGWTIHAGKTDEDNDILSLSFARQNEHWFHVNGMPGSHVILRPPEGQEELVPERRLLEMAAAVAAWHSKARNAGTVSVTTTLARNVSKPKGAHAGLVEVCAVKNIKVRPALPATAADANGAGPVKLSGNDITAKGKGK